MNAKRHDRSTRGTQQPGDSAMLTSLNLPRWAGRRAGLWLQYAAVKIGPAPLAPHSAKSEKGIMVWRLPCERRRIRACGPRAAKQRGAALDRRCAQGFVRRRLEPARGAWTFPASDPVRGGEGLSRARRQPRLADASRRCAVANARVDRCARPRRRAFMGFDGPIRPSDRTSTRKQTTTTGFLP